MLERELKLMASDDLRLTNLDAAIPGATIGMAEARKIADRYFDTPDLRLARWGCTLRFRPGDGWTVKLPVPGNNKILARDEVVVPGEPTTPPAEVLALVRSMTRGVAVEPAAQFDTERTAQTWCNPDGALVAELVDDRVTVETAAGRQTWREIEIELGPDTPAKVAKRLAKHIRATARADGADRAVDIDGGNGVDGASGPGERVTFLQVEHRPKLIRALGPAAEAPPDVVEPGLHRHPTAREVIQAAIARSVAHLILHLPAARIGRDMEGVHQARVATRRLRSDLRTFGPLLEPTWARELSHQLRWLAADLGAVRDADVLLARLRSTIEADPDLVSDGTDRVLAALQRQRSRDNQRLLDELDSERMDRLLDLLVEAAADPRTAPQADDPATNRLGQLVAKRWRRLTEAVASLDDPPVIEDLHDVRILAKRVRYAAEATVPTYGPPAKSLAKSIAGVTDALGELNDAAVAEARLADLAERTKGPTAFAAGRLCQAINDAARPHRDRWQKHDRRANEIAADLGWLR